MLPKASNYIMHMVNSIIMRPYRINAESKLASNVINGLMDNLSSDKVI